MLIFLAWLGGLSEPAAAATLTANLEPDTITLGETATLSLTFEGGNPAGPPEIAGLPDLTVQYLGPSQQISVINGRMTSTTTYNYLVTPAKAGDYLIPAFRVGVGQQTLSTQPLKLKVAAGNAAGADAASALRKLAFLKLVVPKSEIYLGEVLPIEIHLYFQDAQVNSLPALTAEGFTLGKPTQPTQGLTVVGNQTYNVVVSKLTVTAARTGQLTLGPAKCTVTVRVAQANRRRSNPLDPFGGDPFDFFADRFERRLLNLASEPQALRVLPLPAENVPAGFNGAVGRYTLKMQAAPTNVAVGDPITVKIELAGQGALDNLTLPPLEAWRDFKTYSPTSKVETRDPLGLEGTKLFEFVAIPQQTNVQELPALRFSFFDPGQKRYQVLERPPTRIQVRPGAAVAANLPPTSPPANRVAEPAQPDIVNIKTHPGRLAVVQPPLVSRPWFLLVQAIPLVAWLGLYARRKYREILERNPRLIRHRQVEQWLESGLRELRVQAEQNQGEAFYANLFRLMQEQLGDKLDLPSSSITEAVIEERLRPRGVPEETLVLLHELFQKCNQARYAPAQIQEGLFFQVPKAESLFAALKKLVWLWAGLILVLGASALPADDRVAAFDQANKLYAQGQFAEAAKAYESVANTQYESAPLWFNLGNAWFKAGQPGKAIAAYRAALRLSPRDPDLRTNLRFARAQANAGAAAGPGWYLAWTTWLTLNEWAVLAAIGVWVWLGPAAVRHWRPRETAWFRPYTRPIGLVTVFLLVVLGLRLVVERRFSPAVIVVRQAAVRYGPLEESRTAFTLSDGAEVLVVDRQNDWVQIQDAAGRTGWVRTDQTQRIQPS